MKLIIFGDSFSSDHKHDPTTDTWPSMVATRLNVQKGQYFNYSYAGSSIEYSINKDLLIILGFLLGLHL